MAFKVYIFPIKIYIVSTGRHIHSITQKAIVTFFHVLEGADVASWSYYPGSHMP